MVFTLTFLLNAGLNFVLGLAVAGLLGPEEFGRYALAAAVAMLVNTLLFYWLWFSAARFYSDAVRAANPAVRATLDRLLAWLATATVAVAVAVNVLWDGGGMPAALLALGIVGGLAHGLYDFAFTLARARFLDRVYVRLAVARALVGFALMLGAAYVWRDGSAVLAALIVSTAVALAVVGRSLSDAPLSAGKIDPALLRTFLRYSVPLIVGLVVYQAIPFLNRSLIAASYGYAEMGRFSLAYDTISRIFFALGSAFEFILFQLAVRADERDGRAAANAQLGRNVVIVLAVLLPAAAGFWLVLPALAQTIVPAEFRDSFVSYSALLLPAVVAQAAVTSALNGVFQIDKRTAPALAAAVLGLAVNVALALYLPRFVGPAGFALAQVGGLGAALGLSLLLSARVLWPNVRLRDLAVVAAGVAVMVAALAPWRGALAPLPSLLVGIPLGLGCYAAVALAGNVAGCRDYALRLLRRDRSVAAG